MNEWVGERESDYMINLTTDLTANIQVYKFEWYFRSWAEKRETEMQ